MRPFDNTFYSLSQADALYAKAEEHLGKKRLNDLIEEQQKHGVYPPNHQNDAIATAIFGCGAGAVAIWAMVVLAGESSFWFFLFMSMVLTGVTLKAVKSWRDGRLQSKKEIFAAFYLQQQTQGWNAQQIRDLKRTQEFHACEESQDLLEKMAEEVEKQTLPSAQDLVCIQNNPQTVSLDTKTQIPGQTHVFAKATH